MKKNLLFLAFALISLTVSAQHTTPAAKVQQQQIAVSAPLHFGYFSFDKVFHTMPGYAIAKHNMDELREKYDAETKRVETEFNAKYEEFLDGQRTYAKTILVKFSKRLDYSLVASQNFIDNNSNLSFLRIYCDNFFFL